MKSHFEQFALYNRWANARLFAATLALSEEAIRRAIGLFFSSVHGTLNHQLLTDRMWMGRLTGRDPEKGPLDRIIADDLRELSVLRVAEDERLISTIRGYPEDNFTKEVTYQNTSGQSFRQPLSDVLSHLFNHQTHHRSQAHTGLSLITGSEPPGLDLLLFQRGVAAPSANEIKAFATSRQQAI